MLMRIAKKAGIKGLTRLHELRHSYATFLVKRGVDIYRVKELLGHSDIRDTLRYVHFPTEFMKEDVKKLEGLDKG
ncbi:MAG: tyrosine-type recombinase/integrase [Candidatus Omnitrophota bacterium]